MQASQAEYQTGSDTLQKPTSTLKRRCRGSCASALSQLTSSSLINLDCTSQKLGSPSPELMLEASKPHRTDARGMRSCQHQAGSTQSHLHMDYGLLVNQNEATHR